MLTEREEMIVRWLRAEENMARIRRPRLSGDEIAYANALSNAANAIESGEAFKKPSPTIPAEEWVRTPSVG